MAGKRRRELGDFPCPYGAIIGGPKEDSWCDDMCLTYDTCREHDVFQEYLKLQKCARLLKVFMWWIERWKTWTSYGRRVRQGDEIEAAIRSALREAGL